MLRKLLALCCVCVMTVGFVGCAKVEDAATKAADTATDTIDATAEAAGEAVDATAEAAKEAVAGENK
ncbi:MAG: hypothetical protein KF752_18080 [Pirellulaceae bacterium]|nr:hypothetical protein [Pirellulaceae bacterium]